MTLDPVANEEKTLGGSIPPHPRAARAAKEEAPACCQTGSYSGDVRFDLGMHLHHLQLVMSSVAICCNVYSQKNVNWKCKQVVIH